MKLSIRPVINPQELEVAFSIREKVFVQEQSVPLEMERDSSDLTAFHVLAYCVESESHVPAGTARAFANPEQPKELVIGRVAVLKEFRGHGLATRMMEFLLDWAARKGFHSVCLHAQTYIVPLYAKLGFQLRGSEFVEAGIPHCEMSIPLVESAKK